MISSLIGSVIMSGVTLALLLAIEITDKVGKYPLTTQERQILIDAGFNFQDIENINQEIKSLNFND